LFLRILNLNFRLNFFCVILLLYVCSSCVFFTQLATRSTQFAFLNRYQSIHLFLLFVSPVGISVCVCVLSPLSVLQRKLLHTMESLHKCVAFSTKINETVKQSKVFQLLLPPPSSFHPLPLLPPTTAIYMNGSSLKLLTHQIVSLTSQQTGST